ncbi:alpha-2-macroglobulin family protein [Flammeovirga yaeyamensis]|uniref:Alpha-2-macroglobulin family protein n=1 Tax=Flammeovirga yaeyamensis TaxID=367791 RepID=A0AAX1N3P1_9BACT|nr:MG2 domain-containing protein [Flammeovirga yaeyamensis]MBB3700682.1 hypothetical protein [Flammeovirga yaeyamensis]NMF37794.1 alpha-2-macroglobulin family protein [Flammeovirga yaeyamensis]QWG02101.1 alpha-2-macroglobulin family protein [Flammeovirga yaeyamensis]
MKKLNFLIYLSLLIGIFSCNTNSSSSNGDGIAYKNFTESISTKQNITFTFTKSILEDKTGEWLTQDLNYFTITPEVKGQYKWTAKNTLVFSPELGFEPSTKYSLKLSEEALAKEGINLKNTELSYSFATEDLKVVESLGAWSKISGGKPTPTLILKFNYFLDGKSLAEKITVKDKDKKKINTELITSGETNEFTFKLTNVSPASKNQALSIEIGKGVNITKNNKTDYSIQANGFIPQVNELKINSVSAHVEDDDLSIIIKSNQELEIKNIKSQIRITPKVSYEVEKLNDGIKLKGNFKLGYDYTVELYTGIKGIFNTPLKDKVRETVIFGNIDPLISFVDKKSVYLSPKSDKSVDLKIVNVPKVDVDVYKVYKNNLFTYFDDNSLYTESSYSYYGPNFRRLGDKIFSNHDVEVSSMKSNGYVKTLSLDFLDESKFSGVYVVEVRSSKERYLLARKMISISDIGLIAKEGKNSMLVLANSIADASPMPNTEITLVSQNNQEVYTLTTDKDGVAKFTDLDQHAKGFDINMIFAKQGNDFNYMNFQQSRISTSRYEVGGRHSNSSNLMAFIYGDRNLYRPGETIYYKTIVRTEDWEVVQQPILVNIYLPDGNLLKTERAQLNNDGSFEGNVKLMDASVTGNYSIEVTTGNNIILASKRISVEEFMPDRIKVNAELDKDTYEVSENIKASSQVLNMFGPPAANRNYEVDLSLSRLNMVAKDYTEYKFNIDGKVSLNLDNHLRNGSTDEQGNLEESFLLPKYLKNSGLLTAKVYTTVFDETGRPVRRLNTAKISTQPYYLGIKYGDHYIKTRANNEISLIAIDKNQKKVNNAEVKVELYRYEWHSAMERSYNNRYRYVSRYKEILVDSKKMKLGSNSVYSFFPKHSGKYQVRVSLPGASTYTSMDYYAYGWGDVSSTAFEVDKEGRVLIEPEYDTYIVGDKAKVLFKTPFQGKLLVTIEKDNVISHQVIDTNNKMASLEIPIKDEHLPNIFITATLIKGAKDNELPLTVAHGFTSIKVKDADRDLQLKITAPEVSRSRTSQTIEIQTSNKEEDVEVTVAVVDEGILQIKNYKTPDPFGYFYQNRALNVQTYDLYPKVMQFRKQASSFGSDMANLGARANPMVNNRVNLVSFWSGTLKTDRNGKVNYTVDIPEFSGELRVMAVASKGNAFGSADKPMKVRDPLVLSTALPRFLSPSDVNDATIMLANTTDKPMTVSTKLKVEGAVKVEKDNLGSVTIPANSEKMVQFKLMADQTIGEGKVVVIAKVNNEDFISSTNINVRASVGLLKSDGDGVIKGGQSTTIDLKEDYIAKSLKGKLLISKSPLVGFSKDLSYLIRYPYGCVEQTTSAVFPQLYLGELADRFNKTNNKGTVDYNINEAIKKLQSMQMYSGGLSYWQGGSYVSEYGSVYAAHFLLEAQKQGYDVDGTVLGKLLAYVRKLASNKKKHGYYYYNNGSRTRTEVFNKTSLYALYVIAESGHADVSTMNYFKKHKASLDNSSLYLLATTFLRVGDQQSYRLLLPKAFENRDQEKEFGGSFSSRIRDLGLALNSLIETDPKNGQVGVLTKELSEAMKSETYMSTQERAFGLMALGKVLKKASQQSISAQVVNNGKTVGNTDGEDLILTSSDVVGQEVSIKTTGSGELYYFWEIEGLNTTGRYVEEDKGLKVRRKYFNRNGTQITSSNFKQNDLIVIEVTLQSSKLRVENVVVTDMLPAGFEIENPRLGDIPGLNWTQKKAAYPEHVDFRDDRVNFFVTADVKEKKFYYVVRAVSKGTFKQGPVSADAMYNGAYHSYHGAKTIKVE